MLIHRSDMFGLAQLYQLRGRIGRGKVRAYAYLTLPAGKALTETAQRRLEVLQTLDTLGAGFTLASHDLDIRGAGNLLGAEQSGHVREVGIELYQHMLEEAVANARSGAAELGKTAEEEWTPQITIGTPVLIPEAYVADLGIRLGLYRRISTLLDRQRDRRLRRRARRPLRSAAARSRQSAGDHRDQALVPRCRGREGRGGAEGCRLYLPEQ